MTAEQLKTKYAELAKNAHGLLSDYLSRALRSGAVDLESFQDDFTLPKIILCAALKDAASQYRLHSQEFKTEVENIYTCAA